MSVNFHVLQTLNEYYPAQCPLDGKTKAVVLNAVEGRTDNQRNRCSNLLYRIWQAILSVFGCDDFQKAVKSLSSFNINAYKASVRKSLEQNFEQTRTSYLAQGKDLTELLNYIFKRFKPHLEELSLDKRLLEKVIVAELGTLIELNNRAFPCSANALQVQKFKDEIALRFNLKGYRDEYSQQTLKMTERKVQELNILALNAVDDFIAIKENQ